VEEMAAVAVAEMQQYHQTVIVQQLEQQIVAAVAVVDLHMGQTEIEAVRLADLELLF
jgi:hypothetical protein